jgi:uncharacterized protein YuzE
MGKEVMSKESMEGIFKAMPHMLGFPAARFWVDYDTDADVLYISFQRPQKATDAEMTEDEVILRYRGDRMVGLTILDASKRDIKRSPKRKKAH